MRISKMSTLAAAALLGTSLAAGAATLIPVVPVPGSASGTTVAWGINNNDIITGYWFDSGGIQRGYFGTLAGSYTTFDYTGHTAVGTWPRGINDNLLITGWGPTDGSGNYLQGPEFEYNGATGVMKTITEAGTPLDGYVQGIARNGQFAGDYWVHNQDGSYSRYGYLGAKAKWQRDVKVFGAVNQAARGVNKDGVVVGFFRDSNGYAHGFLLQNGVATQVDYPDPAEVDTYLMGINDKGEITGYWDDGGSDAYGFRLNSNTSTFKPIRIRGATYVQPYGLNNAGLITVSSDVGNFIYCPHAPAKCPAAANAQEIADEPGIAVPAGTWLHYAGHAGVRTNASRPGNVAMPQRLPAESGESVKPVNG